MKKNDKSNEEMKKLKKLLDKANEMFDMISNKSKPLQWEPEYRDTYYYVTPGNTVTPTIYVGNDVDHALIAQNNCYRTKEEANRYRNNLITKGELNLLAKELNNGELIDWDDAYQTKYFIRYSHTLKALYLDTVQREQSQGTIYCLSSDFLSRAKKKIGGIRLVEMIKSGV